MMKVAIVFALAFVCVKCQVEPNEPRANFVESLNLVNKNYLVAMLVAQNALNDTADMHFTMLSNALFKLGKSYYVTPHEYDTTFLSLSVEGFAEALEDPQKFITEVEAAFDDLYERRLSVIEGLQDKHCDVSDLWEDCDEKLKKVVYAIGSPYLVPAKVLFKMATLAFHLVGEKHTTGTSLLVRSRNKYPTVNFLSNPHDHLTLEIVDIVADIYDLNNKQ